MQPQSQINLPMKEIAGFVFNVSALIAIDVSQYVAGKEGRSIELILIGPVRHFFTNERADQAYLWYLQITGQARISPVK